MSDEADAELVRRAKSGDRIAIDQLVGPLIDQGFRLAFGMLHDREAAEDSVQESAVRAWRKLGNLKPGLPIGRGSSPSSPTSAGAFAGSRGGLSRRSISRSPSAAPQILTPGST